MTPCSLRSERLELIYVPNLNSSPPGSDQPALKAGEFRLGLNGRSIGAISLVGRGPSHAVIGYSIEPEFCRRGFASEAVAAVLAAAPRFGLSMLTANCRSTNAASRRVLEKTGFALISSVPFTADGSDSAVQYMVYRRSVELLSMQS